MAERLSGYRAPQLTRGHVLIYRPGTATPCPNCGGNQWHVGRQTAECAICETALPLPDKGDRGMSAMQPHYNPLTG